MSKRKVAEVKAMALAKIAEMELRTQLYDDDGNAYSTLRCAELADISKQVGISEKRLRSIVSNLCAEGNELLVGRHEIVLFRLWGAGRDALTRAQRKKIAAMMKIGPAHSIWLRSEVPYYDETEHGIWLAGAAEPLDKVSASLFRVAEEHARRIGGQAVVAEQMKWELERVEFAVGLVRDVRARNGLHQSVIKGRDRLMDPGVRRSQIFVDAVGLFLICPGEAIAIQKMCGLNLH